MAYIKEYWKNKNLRAERAKIWTEYMEKNYTAEIEKASARTKTWTGPIQSARTEAIARKPKYSVVNAGVTDVIQETVKKYKEVAADGRRPKIAVLNFASYKNPGGMFLDGSKAQEECLCHESFLYNVLKRQTDYYAWNRMRLNKALYKARALYTPDVRFFKKGNIKADPDGVLCDVITCAAPNKSAAQKYTGVSDAENSAALKDRIHFLLQVATLNEAEVLILGAYGCGVFGQDPKEVAAIFKDELEKFAFKEAVFAIIKSDRDNNYEAFEGVFGK